MLDECGYNSSMTNLEKVLLLQDIDLFSQMTLEQMSLLAAITQEVIVPKGKRLYSEGDVPDGLYILVSGSVLMRRAGHDIDRIRPNGLFGVWALFDDEPRMATAVTVEESRMLYVPREDFYDLLSDHVEIVAGLFKHLVRRVRRLATAVEK